MLPHDAHEIWFGSLIRALAPLGFRSSVVRVTASRMQRAGFLQSRRQGRYSFYRLTELGVNEVRRGGNRAFTEIEDRWDENWTVVTYSVPEKHRNRRDKLRSLLNDYGFGMLSPGTWISPRPLCTEIERKWQELRVEAYLEVFKAEHLGPSDLPTIVGRAWPQLPEIEERYRAYIAMYERLLRDFKADGLGEKKCFAIRLQCLGDFVVLNLEDPALPSPLLPTKWPRLPAQQLFRELRRAMADPAERFFKAVYAEGEEKRHGKTGKAVCVTNLVTEPSGYLDSRYTECKDNRHKAYLV